MHSDERSIVIATSDSSLALEGILEGASDPDVAGAVIAPPHPLYGGSLESPVVGEVAHACGSAGMATIRFNWRGVGASAGERSGNAEDADLDYGAALETLAESVAGPLVAAGYSFGAAAALRCGTAHPRVRRLVLVAPPPSLLDVDALAAFAGDVLLVTGADDELAPAAELEALVAGHDRRALEVIDDTDHFFMVGLGPLGRLVRDWLRGGAGVPSWSGPS